MMWIARLFGGFSIRAWLVAGAIAAFAIWNIYLVRVGYSWADSAWQAKALEAKVAKLELELQIQRDADTAEDKLRTELEAENEQQKRVIDAYLEELRTRPDKCLLGPDAERLQ